MNLRIYTITLLGALVLAGCGGPGKKQAEPAHEGFRMPDIPVILTSPEERASFLAVHFWDHFDFADTTQIGRPQITEQAMADYLNTLGYIPPAEAGASITATLDRALDADSSMFAHFTGLLDKYLYDPNSPMRNEELYLPVLRFIIASDRVSELDKVRPHYRLALALRNRPGDMAADFGYTLADGRTGRLSGIKSEYTLLFFNNPDCHDCARVKEYITQSPALGANPALKVLALYPDEDLAAWHKTTYPAGWINAYDKGGAIKAGELYDLKAIPCLYLLSRDKRVLLKDAPVEAVEQYLATQMPQTD